ncbi:hypothetical protein KUCAC02_006245, partial [Chaenocephalus aceratus]
GRMSRWDTPLLKYLCCKEGRWHTKQMRQNSDQQQTEEEAEWQEPCLRRIYRRTGRMYGVYGPQETPGHRGKTHGHRGETPGWLDRGKQPSFSRKSGRGSSSAKYLWRTGTMALIL